MSRLHGTERRTRVHRSRGDSAQNESERTNACIGEALADGSALHWEYYSMDDTPKEELKNMTLQQINKLEEDIAEKNAWRVAHGVRERIHMEPGPAGDLMFAEVENESSAQFFNNTAYLLDYNKAGKEKKKHIPGYNYFLKIANFVDEHTERGEIFMEYRKGMCCKDGTLDPCNFCND